MRTKKSKYAENSVQLAALKIECLNRLGEMDPDVLVSELDIDTETLLVRLQDYVNEYMETTLNTLEEADSDLDENTPDDWPDLEAGDMLNIGDLE